MRKKIPGLTIQCRRPGTFSPVDEQSPAMKDLIKIDSHPIFTHADDLQMLCRPLACLGITYFSRVVIHENNAFSALANNPRFVSHYLENQYYNVDIHHAAKDPNNRLILWDSIEIFGKSAQMHHEASSLGVNHTFTIIRSVGSEKHYNHFAIDRPGSQINQIYLTHLDLLEKFAEYFSEQVARSASLRNAHIITFDDAPTPQPAFVLPENSQDQRQQFLEILKQQSNNQGNFLEVLQSLPPQQFRCLQILMNGASIKEVARQLMLSPRTVEHHLEKIRKSLGVRTNRKLVSALLSSRVFPLVALGI